MKIIELAKPAPTANPPKPAAGSRATYVITFDYADADTAGMVEALRTAGVHTAISDRFPRTSVVCRVAVPTNDEAFLETVSDALQANGSAVVARIGGGVFMWPERPWKGDKVKRWLPVPA